MTAIILFNTLISLLTVYYFLYILNHSFAFTHMEHLRRSYYCMFVISCLSLGQMLSRISDGFLPYQNLSLTLFDTLNYLVQLYAAIQAYWYFRPYKEI